MVLCPLWRFCWQAQRVLLSLAHLFSGIYASVIYMPLAHTHTSHKWTRHWICHVISINIVARMWSEYQPRWLNTTGQLRWLSSRRSGERTTRERKVWSHHSTCLIHSWSKDCIGTLTWALRDREKRVDVTVINVSMHALFCTGHRQDISMLRINSVDLSHVSDH